MQGKSKTKAELRRFDEIQQRGCVCCYLEAQLVGRRYIVEPCDIHHVNQSARVGHHFDTVGLCPWHHRDVCKNDAPVSEMLYLFGPNMVRHRAEWVSRYGGNEKLLEVQAELLAKEPHTL